MSEQYANERSILDRTVLEVEDSHAEVESTVQQSSPWHSVCSAGAMPTLSTLAAVALVNLPDLIPLIYGGGRGSH